MSCSVNPLASQSGMCFSQHPCHPSLNQANCLLLGTAGMQLGTPCCKWDPIGTRTTGCVSGGSCSDQNCSQHSSQEECQSNSKTECACATPGSPYDMAGPQDCPDQEACGMPCCKWLGNKSKSSPPRSSIGVWVIAGIVIGSLAFIALVVFIVLRMRKKKAGRGAPAVKARRTGAARHHGRRHHA